MLNFRPTAGYTLPLLLAITITVSTPLWGEDQDQLVFTDGEHLTGHFIRSTQTSLTFHSNMAGDITVDWAKVKELRSSTPLAVVPKDVKFGRHRDAASIPQGKVVVENQKVEIAREGGTTQSVAVADTSYIVDQATFAKSLKRPGLFQDWKGSASAGVSLVLATQNSRSITSAVTLVRAIPTEPWLNPENKTALNFSSAYGELTQPGQPLTKTSIYHADGERDEYFNPSLYTFAEAAFDHNFSQGLDLQQTLGGGVGWTVVRTANEQFDLKAQLDYIDQKFLANTAVNVNQLAEQNQHLIGSVFSETYDHKFSRGFTLHELISASPAWSNLQAYSATGDVVFTIPVTKHFSVNLNTLDTFLNNPSPGFRKNSFQFSTGLTYVLP